MAHTRAWSVTKADPVDTDLASGLGDDIRTQADDIEERMVIDHDWDSVTTGGEHTALHLQEQGVAPTVGANYGGLYAALGPVSGKSELFYKDEDGNVVQLTAGGKIPLGGAGAATDLLLENNVALQGEDTVGPTAQNLIKIDAGDIIRLGDQSYPADIDVDDLHGLTVSYPAAGDQEIWHAGNDGHASGLDADTLDGQEAVGFVSYDLVTPLFYTNSAAPLAIPAGNTVTNLAHGLGVVPNLVRVTLRCVNVAGDYGYAQDDEIDISTDPGTGYLNAAGLSWHANATNVVIMMQANRVIRILQKISPRTWLPMGTAPSVWTSWAIVARAWV